VVEPQAVSAIGGAGVVTDVEASAPVAAAGGSAGGGGARRASRPAEGTDRVELPVPATRSGAVNGEGDDGSEVVLVATLGRGAAAHPGARATSAAPSSRIAYDVAPTIVGRITTAAGVPIAGAQIDVVSQATTAGAHGRIDGAARTDDDGRFTYRAAAGASRILTFGYRRTLADRAYARVVHVSVRAVPTITLSVDRVQLHNQATVSFTGRVLGEPAGSHRVVELQVLQRGRWTTFATTRLTGGAYRHRYRFTRTFRSTRYRFRARAAKDPTVALETTVSATRAIEVLR
jgi:hypothetical protein